MNKKIMYSKEGKGKGTDKKPSQQQQQQQQQQQKESTVSSAPVSSQPGEQQQQQQQQQPQSPASSVPAIAPPQLPQPRATPSLDSTIQEHEQQQQQLLLQLQQDEPAGGITTATAVTETGESGSDTSSSEESSEEEPKDRDKGTFGVKRKPSGGLTWPRKKGKVQLLGLDGSDLESGDESSMKRSNPMDEALKPLFAKGMYPSNSEVLTALKSANVEGQFAKVFSRWNPHAARE